MDQSTRIPWSQDCLRDLRWWLHLPRSLRGRLSVKCLPTWTFGPTPRTSVGGSLGSSHRFRPLEPRGKSAFHQRKGTSGSAQRSPPLPVISSGEDSLCFLRQQHSSCLPPQGGRHEVSLSEFSGSGDSPLVGVPLPLPGSPVHPWVSECSSGHSVPPSPAASYRVVPQSGGLSVFMSSVAGPNRLVCYLRESPML